MNRNAAPSPQQAEVVGANSIDKGDLKFRYQPRKNFRAGNASHRVGSNRQALEQVIADLNERLALPFDIAVSFEDCDELPDAGSRTIAKKLFRSLARECCDGREYGDVLKLREVCAPTGAGEADVAAVVEVFRRDGRSFLTPPPARPLTAESLLELSYTDLLHGWGRLKSWAEEPPRG